MGLFIYLAIFIFDKKFFCLYRATFMLTSTLDIKLEAKTLDWNGEIRFDSDESQLHRKQGSKLGKEVKVSEESQRIKWLLGI